MSSWAEDAASGVSPDAEQAFARRREKRKDERKSEGGKWRNTSPGRLVLGHEIRSRGDDQGIGSGGDLCLWASRDVRPPGSACGSVPTFGGAREPDQHSGWEGTELVSTGRLESANE